MTDRHGEMQEFRGVVRFATTQRRIVSVFGKKFLPETVIEEFMRYRAFEGSERLIFLRSRILNGIGWPGPKRKPSVENARSFLFVCFGNIMRSPMCEKLMKRAVAEFGGHEFKIQSAGLNALPGRTAHPWAVEAAREFGISLENHQARLLTSEMVDEADIIFAMDWHNFVQLLDRWRSARRKVFMLSAYAGKEYKSQEIFDPYYKDQEATVRCYKVLQTCIQNLAADLSKRLRPTAITEPTQPCGP
jgi:protein-tyrosine-phosphatase